MNELDGLFAALRRAGTKRSDPTLTSLGALEKVSGVSRKTVLRWRTVSPTLSHLVSVVESLGGIVKVELPPAVLSQCGECGDETATLRSGKTTYCGRCGQKKE